MAIWGAGGGENHGRGLGRVLGRPRTWLLSAVRTPPSRFFGFPGKGRGEGGFENVAGISEQGGQRVWWGKGWGCGEALQGKREGRDGQAGGREWVGHSPCGLGCRLPPRRGVHCRVPPLPPRPLPFRRDCSNPESEDGGAAGESPPSPQLEDQVVCVWGGGAR